MSSRWCVWCWYLIIFCILMHLCFHERFENISWKINHILSTKTWMQLVKARCFSNLNACKILEEHLRLENWIVIGILIRTSIVEQKFDILSHSNTPKYSLRTVLLQGILSIFPACVHQFYANVLVFVNINPFLYINDQFALVNINLFLNRFSQYLHIWK